MGQNLCRLLTWHQAIAAAVLEIVAAFAYRESHVPTLLRYKKARLVKLHGDAEYYTVLDLNAAAQRKKSVASVLEMISRPSKLADLDISLLVLVG